MTGRGGTATIAPIMDGEVIQGVTVGDLVFLGSAILGGLVASLVVRLAFRLFKARLRRASPGSIRAHLVDDLDGALSLWIVVTGLYVGLNGLPLLSDYHAALVRVFVILSIAIVLYGGIRVQDDAIRWGLGLLGERTGQGRVMESMIPMATQIVAIVTMVMGGLIILDQMGISIAPLLAGLGIGGLAVALALQGTLTNMFAGLSVMTDGSIRVGDYVELDNGMIGAIDGIGWRTTRVRLLSDNIVFIPTPSWPTTSPPTSPTPTRRCRCTSR